MDDCGPTSAPSRPSTTPSPPSTRPSDTTGRRSSAFAREDSGTPTRSAVRLALTVGPGPANDSDVLHLDGILPDLEELRVGVDHGVGIVPHPHLAVLHPDRVVGELLDRP